MSKRVKILESAAQIMTADGINSLTISKVANKADIGKGTVYEYFKSKDDLICKTISFVGDKYIDELKNYIFSLNGGFEELLKAYIKVMIDTMRSGNNSFTFLIGEGHKIYKPKMNMDKDNEFKNVLFDKRKKMIDILDSIIGLGIQENVFERPSKPILYIALQNTLMMLAFEFSGVDLFLAKNNIHIGSDEENIEFIYNYIVKMLND